MMNSMSQLDNQLPDIDHKHQQVQQQQDQHHHNIQLIVHN
jgi:hypothetical protein